MRQLRRAQLGSMVTYFPILTTADSPEGDVLQGSGLRISQWSHMCDIHQSVLAQVRPLLLLLMLQRPWQV
jgi:uncharacterized protein YijF (DUF1287 family)